MLRLFHRLPQDRFQPFGLGAAGTIFRMAILLYGQRITPPEIVRWVRVG